jgi:hypothetical protein
MFTFEVLEIEGGLLGTMQTTTDAAAHRPQETPNVIAQTAR